MLDQITPVLLTYNEDRNIDRSVEISLYRAGK